MADQAQIQITDYIENTDYYEMGYKPNDEAIFTTFTVNTPLQEYMFGSPATMQQGIAIGNLAIPLAAGITYDVRIKRFYGGGSSNYSTFTINT